MQGNPPKTQVGFTTSCLYYKENEVCFLKKNFSFLWHLMISKINLQVFITSKECHKNRSEKYVLIYWDFSNAALPVLGVVLSWLKRGPSLFNFSYKFFPDDSRSCQSPHTPIHLYDILCRFLVARWVRVKIPTATKLPGTYKQTQRNNTAHC